MTDVPCQLADGDRITVRIGPRAFVGVVVATGGAGDAEGTAHGWRIDVATGASWAEGVRYGPADPIAAPIADPPTDLWPDIPDAVPVTGIADHPMVHTLADADRWVRILHRWATRDADRFNLVEDRVRHLETPRWRRRWRR